MYCMKKLFFFSECNFFFFVIIACSCCLGRFVRVQHVWIFETDLWSQVRIRYKFWKEKKLNILNLSKILANFQLKILQESLFLPSYTLANIFQIFALNYFFLCKNFPCHYLSDANSPTFKKALFVLSSNSVTFTRIYFTAVETSLFRIQLWIHKVSLPKSWRANSAKSLRIR